jgi:hypothetical protein
MDVWALPGLPGVASGTGICNGYEFHDLRLDTLCSSPYHMYLWLLSNIKRLEIKD